MFLSKDFLKAYKITNILKESMYFKNNNYNVMGRGQGGWECSPVAEHLPCSKFEALS